MKMNQILRHYEVAETLKAIRMFEETEFMKQIQTLYGTDKAVVSDEYHEKGTNVRSWKVKVPGQEDIYLVLGFTEAYGKISVFMARVEAPLSVLLAPSTFDKVIHVSHDDLDGESPLIFTRLAFTADKEVITRACSYDRVDEIVMNLIQTEMQKENTIMFITDINVSPENLEKIHCLVQKGYRIFIMDHHDVKEGVPVEKYCSWMKIDQFYPDGRGTAATSMYYDFLVEYGFLSSSSIMDDYVELVRLYDTWEWDDIANQAGDEEERKGNIGIRAKRLNDYFFMSNNEEFSEQVLVRFADCTESRFAFDYPVQYMLDTEQKKIDEFCFRKMKQIQIFRGLVDDTDRIYSYEVVIAETYISELGNYLCKELIDEIDFIVMIDVGRGKLSLRSNKNKPVDVGAIARSVGGGGRAQTAGCPLNARTKYLFLDQLVGNLVY
ncbi:DHHA1 domain-containing protein (plasmid) [Paenibacillus thiaminolyticus]|uniref:DHH family phosphoesterase n=1 Tax=Paenibacillus thiaminolyticus TaxID=49283 RepID=UPI00232DDAD9|nr:DHHA1 domain-containing protein [Paenibacillus thiaminolyticus]WCF11655.1 DHHA1 domain-containing protein [Paenibacillus thiaminolyticus]